MTRSPLELVGQAPAPIPPAPAPEPQRALPAIVAGGALFLLAAVVTWAMHREMDAFLSSLDERVVEQAGRSLEGAIEQQRTTLLSEVRVLSEDTRVRSTVMTPDFDEATVKDVLEDLKKASGASVLAVLDVNGKVRAVTGAQGLHHVDLGSTPVVKAAMEQASANVWTFPEQVVVIAVAPVRTGGETSALFLMGYEIGAQALARIGSTHGVAGAVLIRDRVAAASSTDPVVTQAIRMAIDLEDGKTHVIGGERPYVARITRTSNSAVAGRIVWLVAHHHEGHRATVLRAMTWAPAALVGLMFALFVLVARSRFSRES
jgi:hypothetical protein